MTLLVDFILVGGILITLLIIFLLLKIKRRELPHKILFLFFILLLLVSLNFYAQHHNIGWLYIISFIPEDSIVWFIGPLLMLYIKALFLDPSKLINRNVIHFTPFLLYIAFISIPVLISQINNEFLFDYLQFFSSYINIMIILRGLFLIVYIIYCKYLFNKYLELIKTSYSTLSEHDFLWIRRMLFGVMIVISIDVLSEIYEMIFGYLTWDTGFITVIAMIILIGYLGYYGVNQSKILLPNFLLREDEQQKDNLIETKASSSINFSKEEVRLLEEKLETILQEQQPYLDEDLTLNKLAQLIPITDKKLSTFLNQYMNTTFYDIVNEYRVEAVKEKFKSKEFENYTLLGIAYDSGFKSKTSFNRIFKKETGLSPSEYKKNL